MARDHSRKDVATVIADVQSSLAFLTRIPTTRLFGGGAAGRPDFTEASWAFPLVGILVGVAGGAVLLAAATLGAPPVVAAGLAVLATFLVTGGLHEDGLADTMDGFGGGTMTEQKLGIMKDSRIGTYGASALAFSFILRIGALSGLAAASPLTAGLALVAAETAARAAMVQAWRRLPPARAEGLAHETGAPSESATWIATAIAVIVVVLLAGPAAGFATTLLAALFSVAATTIFIGIADRQIQGRTGDTLGACQQIAAVAFLVGASVASS